jgi:hypothetical protein
MLQLRNTPRRPWENLLMAGTDQQQIRQHRNAKGFLDALLLRTDLGRPQPQVGLQFPMGMVQKYPAQTPEIQNLTNKRVSMTKAFILGINGQDGSYLVEVLQEKITRCMVSFAVPPPAIRKISNRSSTVSISTMETLRSDLPVQHYQSMPSPRNLQ